MIVTQICAGAYISVNYAKAILNEKEKNRSSVARFIAPDWGDEVASGMGLSYWQAGLHRLECLLYCILMN
jgi:hypothetical protein